MNPPTRPASADAADIAKWKEEMEAYRARVDQEQEFRDTAMQFFARTDTTLTNMREDMLQHAAEDREQFRRERRARKRLERKVQDLSGQVNQTVETNRYNWGVAAAWVSAFVAVAGAGWAFIQAFGKSLKP